MSCLEESKLDEYDKIEVPGYVFYSKPRTEKYIRKSGGVGFFVRKNIAPCIDIMESNCEYVFWIKLNKSFFCNFDNDIVLGVMYIPPNQSKFFNDDEYFKFENEISSKCSEFTYCMLFGDVNAHTSCLTDYVMLDDFLTNQFIFDENVLHDFNSTDLLLKEGFPIKRISKDKKVNTNGLKLLETCKSNNLYIVNGRVGSDKNVGNFTFRNTSVIDYILSTANCFQYFMNFEILEVDSLFSDGHALLALTINTSYNTKEISVKYVKERVNSQTKTNNKPPKWQDSLSIKFVENINREHLISIENKINTNTEKMSRSKINEIAQDIGRLFDESSRNTFPTVTYNKYHSKSVNNKPWFGPACNKARRSYHKARKKIQLS